MDGIICGDHKTWRARQEDPQRLRTTRVHCRSGTYWSTIGEYRTSIGKIPHTTIADLIHSSIIKLALGPPPPPPSHSALLD